MKFAAGQSALNLVSIGLRGYRFGAFFMNGKAKQTRKRGNTIWNGSSYLQPDFWRYSGLPA